jgi:hypothetical protein
MAPEMIKHSQYSIKSDTWAFAVTLMEIVTHDEPYPEYQSLQVVNVILFVQLANSYPFFFLNPLLDFIGCCWNTASYLSQYSIIRVNYCNID